MKDMLIARAEQIAGDFLQERIQASYPIIGKGIMNQVCVVETVSRKVVVRMNDKGAFTNFHKEKWCIEQAAAVGVPGPVVLSIGMTDETAYMIQGFVEGVNGLDTASSKTEIWRTLGAYAKLIHSIPVNGYGENLIDPERGQFQSPPHAGSDGSWLGYVQYNIDCVNENDPLIELGVLTKAKLQAVREVFKRLKQEPLRFGLDHGDLSIKNAIVTPARQVILLDWNAEVNAIPHVTVARLLQYRMLEIVEGPNDEQFGAFMDGYGLSAADLTITRHFLLLRAFDNLRWAVDRSPEHVQPYAAFAKQVMATVMD